MHADVHFATFEPVNGEPIDKFGVHWTYCARQHGYPCADRINPPAQARHSALNAGSGAAIKPIGGIGHHRLKSLPQHRQRTRQRLQRDGCVCGGIDNRGVGISQFGFQTIAAFGGIGFVAGKHHRANRRQKPFNGARGRTFCQPRQPTIAGQCFCRHSCHFDGKAAFFVIRCDIGEARRQTTASAAGFAFGANHPAAQLDGFLASERGRKHRVGSIEQMMALVENDTAWAVEFITTARGIDHHQRMIGDDYFGLNR